MTLLCIFHDRSSISHIILVGCCIGLAQRAHSGRNLASFVEIKAKTASITESGNNQVAIGLLDTTEWCIVEWGHCRDIKPASTTTIMASMLNKSNGWSVKDARACKYQMDRCYITSDRQKDHTDNGNAYSFMKKVQWLAVRHISCYHIINVILLAVSYWQHLYDSLSFRLLPPHCKR